MTLCSTRKAWFTLASVALPGFGVTRLAIVTEIFVEGGPVLAQREREALSEIVVRRNTVGEECSLALSQVAADVTNHEDLRNFRLIRTSSSSAAG